MAESPCWARNYLQGNERIQTVEDEVKEEIPNLLKEVERKLTENKNELKPQQVDISKAQTRIAEVEEWKTDATEVLSEMVEQTRRMKGKLTDLETKDKQYPEETEGNSTVGYMEHLLKTELEQPKETNLQIQ